MAIIESINEAKKRGATDAQIIAEIGKQNPAKNSVIQQARSRGADDAAILGEIVKQNTTIETPQAPSPVGEATGVLEFLKTKGLEAGKGFVKSGVESLQTLGKLPLQAYGKAFEAVTGSPILAQEAEKAGFTKEQLERKTTAEKVGAGVEQIMEFALPSAKIAKVQKGLGVIKKGAIEAISLGTQTFLHEGEIDSSVKDAVIIGALFPSVVKVGGIIKKSIVPSSGKVMDSLIKPLLKDFSYGKDPGRAVAKEGLVADSLEELGSLISQSRQITGQKLQSRLSTLEGNIKLNLESTLSPIDEAMTKAAANNNKTLLQRLNDVKTALVEDLAFGIEEGQPIIISRGKKNLKDVDFVAASKMKTDIGDMTKWTGNLSDDQIANKALKQVYGEIKEEIIKGARKVNPKIASEIEMLNEKYADLTSAEIATKYRDKILARQDLISLKSYTFGIGSMVVTAIMSGGQAIPAVLAGIGGTALDKILATPSFKTRFARILTLVEPDVKKKLFADIPALRGAIERVFGE